MQISRYILELLSENECVIIPGFGAFTANYNPAYIDDNQETLHPPSKEISFNGKLKNDDGLLTNYLSKKEGISQFDALKKIEEFRENSQYQLEKGEEIIFEGLGKIKLDEKNSTIFYPEINDNLLLDSFGLSTTSLKNETSPANNKKEAVVVKENSTKSKAWLLFLLIPFAAIIVFVYLKFLTQETSESPVLENENQITLQENNNEIFPDSTSSNIDTTTTDSIIQSEVIEEPEIAETDTVINYYLIGGSFLEEVNAEKYLRQIEELGYNPVLLGKQGDYYVVAVGGYKYIEEANAVRMEFLNRDPDSEVWVLDVSD